ncbi:MAG: TetR/AcrR family transcriptional regulator [Acidimicrobiales bacterium]
MSEDELPPEDSSGWSESLRERKKRLTRSLVSNTATEMFLEQGFEDVKVADIAAACGVSEKTVYNYFPTKESLLFDGEADTAAKIWLAVGPGSTVRSPVEGMVELLGVELDELHAAWVEEGMPVMRRFADLIDATPSLQGALRDMSDRLERTAAEALAAQAGVSPEEPEPRLAAAILMALWRIQFDCVLRCAADDRTPDETAEIATAEVARAARVAESGMWWFGALVEDRATGPQLKSAADTAVVAGRQVVTAVRQARAAWQQMQGEGRPHGKQGHPIESWAEFLGEAERWKRDVIDWKKDMADQHDEWKRAYRDQQQKMRQARRELQQKFRQQRHHGRRLRGYGGLPG